MTTAKIYNDDFVKILEELGDIMSRHGETFKARAYQKASETIMTFPEDITTLTQLIGKPTMGKSVLSTLQEYVDTGMVKTIEKNKHDPLNLLTRVFGIGPKKAREFIEAGIDSIEKLKQNQDKLTSAQKIGVEFYEDIEKKIPRDEIDEYKEILTRIMKMKSIPIGTTFEIVGSYRRGMSMSGDIDIIITNKTNQTHAFNKIIDLLIENKIITHILSRGRTKSLSMAKLPDKPSRRVDLLYTPPDEYAFAILYFTGSKAFNTMQRQKAIDMGYTLNEHGIHYIKNGEKGEKVNQVFSEEKDIFNFLGMAYKEPHERKNGRDTYESSVCESNKKKKLVSPVMVYINRLKSDGIEFLDTLTEKEIESIIKTANQEYYSGNSTLMTDDLYDMICDYTMKKYPHNTISTAGHNTLTIGETVKNKVRLPYELWSMDKIKPETDALSKWTAKYKGPYILSCKLDGVSGLYISPDKLYTRGNGQVGQDISHMIPYLRLPKTAGLVIRGEIIIQKEIFLKKYSKDFSNPRNFVAGVVNQKQNSSINRVKDVEFVAYEIIKPSMTPSKQLETLTSIDIKTVTYKIQSSHVSTELLSEWLTVWRKTSIYEIDGIICCNDGIYARKTGNPEHAFAFKMVCNDQVAETKVVNVEWNVSKDGYLKPRVQLEPIMIGGTKIEYATGFNAKFIVDNNIGVGAVISIVRSGDVIPHIQHVIRGSDQPLMPVSKYTWNETNVDIMLEDYKTDHAVIEKQIVLFFKTIGVDGLGVGNIKKIIDAGYNTIPEILSMSRESFMKIDGFKQKLSDKIYDGIQDKFHHASLPVLMEATNIFGRGFGKKKFQMILHALPDIIISKMSNQDKTLAVSKISGMASNTAEKFIDKLSEFKEWAKMVGIEHKLQFTPILVTENTCILLGKRIVLTGFRDKYLMEKIEQHGAIICSSITKLTDMVIIKDLDHQSNKTQQAKSLGIPILSCEEFIMKYTLT